MEENEVKSSASQTRNIFEEIGMLVTEIQPVRSDTARTMARMNDVSTKTTEANCTITSAVGQQSGATQFQASAASLAKMTANLEIQSDQFISGVKAA